MIIKNIMIFNFNTLISKLAWPACFKSNPLKPIRTTNNDKCLKEKTYISKIIKIFFTYSSKWKKTKIESKLPKSKSLKIHT